MKTWTFRTLALTAALVAFGLVVITAGAAGNEEEHNGAFPVFAGPHQGHFAARHLIDDLGLSATQQTHIEAIHTLISSGVTTRHERRGSHLAWAIERIQQGEVDGIEAKTQIDQHLDALRDLAYGVVDETVALVDSLDDEQRELLIERLENAQARMERHHGRNWHGWLQRLHDWHGGH